MTVEPIPFALPFFVNDTFKIFVLLQINESVKKYQNLV